MNYKGEAKMYFCRLISDKLPDQVDTLDKTDPTCISVHIGVH